MKKHKLAAFTWSCKRSWYFRHPIFWLKELTYNFHCVKQRILYGYCDMDWYNFRSWFLYVIPQMLRDMENKGYSFPKDGPYNTKEAWDAWLDKTASALESCQEQNRPKNEYQEELTAVVRKNITFDELEFKGKVIYNKFITREKEIADERFRILSGALMEIAENFDDLWD